MPNDVHTVYAHFRKVNRLKRTKLVTLALYPVNEHANLQDLQASHALAVD